MTGGPPAPRFAARGVPPLHYLGRVVGQPPVWLETRVFLENLRLHGHDVFIGDGLPRGSGQPVIVIPGFMAHERSISTLQDWLLRMGYHAEAPGLGFNVRHSEAVLGTLIIRLVDLYGWLGQRVVLIGHSRGGLLAKVASHRHPEMVERVITLGSPLADPYDIHPFTMACVRVAQLMNLARFRTFGSVESSFLSDLAARARRPLTSIYSRSDGIVHWKACLRDDADCIEVEGSHTGLAVNSDVYGLVAKLLARSWQNRSVSQDLSGGG
jgi:triacylglycerol lipase